MPRGVRSGVARLGGVHPVEWVYLGLGAALVWRHFFLFDDAFVYFRYVDSWLFLGLGLVYNAGEYVEGFTSPLWTLLLAGLRSTEASWTAIARASSLGALLAFWALGVRLRQRLAPRGVVLNLPLAWLCGLYPVTTWFSSGSETPLLQVAAAAYALFAFRPGSRPLQVALALSPLVRHELAPSLAVLLLFTWARDRRAAVHTALLASLFGAAWLAFRIVYYADLFPNTFHLKHGWSPGQGLVYLHDTLRPYHFYALALGLAATAAVLRARSVAIEGAPRLALLLAALPALLYPVAVGGASTHYRMLAFPVCLCVFATAGLPERALVALAPRLTRATAVGAALLGLLLFGAVSTLRPPQLAASPYEVGHIADAAYHRARIGTDGLIEQGLEPARLREAATDARLHQQVLVTGWCAGAWRRIGVRVIHRHGLTDAILARAEVAGARPGHRGRPARRMAEDVARLQRDALAEGRAPGRGLYRRALRSGPVPPWVTRSLPTLERIERKIYNRHRPLENLALALRPVGAIAAPDAAPGEADRAGPRDGARDPR